MAFPDIKVHVPLVRMVQSNKYMSPRPLGQRKPFICVTCLALAKKGPGYLA